MSKRVRLMALGLGMVLLFGLIGASWMPATAAVLPPGCTPPATPMNLAVQPALIVNTQPNTITVTSSAGSFATDAVVILDGYGVLATTFVNSGILTAVVPAGVPGAINGRPYTVQVLNPAPTNTCQELIGGISIMSPAPPGATATLTPSPLPTNYIRPIVTVLSYGASSRVVYPGQEIDFEMTVQNTGALGARNVMVAFSGQDLIPRDTGGLRSLGDIAPGGMVRFWQPLRVNSSLGGYEAVINIEIRYTDEFGTPYTDASTISLEAGQYGSTPTPTPTLAVRPQLIITEYRTDPDVLNPGMVFSLDLDLVNLSGETARQVVVTLKQTEISLGSLAPLSSSNVRYIEVMGPGARSPISYQLQVNGDAEGGLVPLDLEITYLDNANTQITQTQSISLPIDAAPHLQIRLFEPLPDLIMVGDQFELAVEVINIGTQSANTSTVEVITDNRLLAETDSVYIGPLDAGTSGSLVTEVSALQAGTGEITVQVNYLNSFQQPETATLTLEIPVEAEPAGPPPGEGPEAEPPDDGELTLGERLLRALLGFFGLGTRSPDEMTIPTLEAPEEQP